VENLFDLEDDLFKEDEEFTPLGRKHVTSDILDLKLDHLCEVLKDINADILGLAEVENRSIIEMLIKRYKGRNYAIVHYESPDIRGIDTALLYDSLRFSITSSKPISVDLGENRPTRDILYVKGTFVSSDLHLFVNHWPSHWEGTEKTNPFRAKAAKVLRSNVDHILEQNPVADIIILGDLNDQPTAASVTSFLGATMLQDSIDLRKQILWNLMTPFLNKQDEGTYKYQGQDLIYDQIIVSTGLGDTRDLTLKHNSQKIVDKPKYRQQRGKYRGYPFRFWAGDSLLGGYSDHLAVKVTVIHP